MSNRFRLKFYDLCCLFCCPPCPNNIASKLAFYPPELSYSIDADNSSISFCNSFLENFPAFNIDLLNERRKVIKMCFTRTLRCNQIATMFLKCSSPAKYTILYSHGNAVDLGYMCNFYLELSELLNCNIFSYDYSGYGQSEGSPSEKNMYADADAAWHAILKLYGISPEFIILYGQSIGTAATIDLASKYEVAGVVLHSPLTSGMRVVCPSVNRTWCFDSFPNIDKASKIKSPVLVVHGTNDEIIDFSHGQAIYERCPRAVEPLWLDGAGHNDVEYYSEYTERLIRFINEELAS